MESTKVVAKNSRSNSKERSSIGRPGKENNLKQVKKGHKKVATPKTTVNWSSKNDYLENWLHERAYKLSWNSEMSKIIYFQRD